MNAKIMYGFVNLQARAIHIFTLLLICPILILCGCLFIGLVCFAVPLKILSGLVQSLTDTAEDRITSLEKNMRGISRSIWRSQSAKASAER